MNKLTLLKNILNGLTDKELEGRELWINNEDEVKIIAIDDDGVTLVTEETEVKLNGMEW